MLTLDPSTLVDALMKLSAESRSAHMLVTSLASTTKENIALFKKSIHSITHQSRRYSLTGEQIYEILNRSLDMLDPVAIDPKLGLELMASFYETDSWALESTTELDFEFSMIYEEDGFAKFTEFAQSCSDSEYVAQIVKRLLSDDGYSMRTKLLDEVSTFLSEEGLKILHA